MPGPARPVTQAPVSSSTSHLCPVKLGIVAFMPGPVRLGSFFAPFSSRNEIVSTFPDRFRTVIVSGTDRSPTDLALVVQISRT